MSALERFFLQKSKWIIFFPLFLIMLSSVFFHSKHFFERTESGSTSMNIGHPFPFSVMIIYMAIWYWTLSNYFNNTLDRPYKYDLKNYRLLLMLSSVLFIANSVFSYINAELLFRTTTIFVIATMINVIGGLFFIYCTWLTNKIINSFLSLNNENGIIQTFFFFPFRLWKLQPTIQVSYRTLEHKI